MNPGKRYGLIIPKKDVVEKKKQTLSSVFGDDSSDSDKDTTTDWKKKAFQAEAKKGVKRQTKLEMERALAEDPTVYQYDEIYDEIDQKKTDKVAAKKKEEKKPRYIQSLLKQAERRKQETERRNERQVQLDREKEGAEFGDKETFVTSSYRKKLEEFKKLDEEERRMDMLEEIGDVSKQQDLGGFYRHLYQTTLAADENKDKVYNKPDFSDKKLDAKSSEEKTEKPEVPSPSSNVIKSQEKNSRSYRKRKNSESSGEEEEKEKEIDRGEKRKKKKKVEDNPDADTSQSSSSDTEDAEDNGSEEGEIIDRKKKKAKLEKQNEKSSKPKVTEEDETEGKGRLENKDKLEHEDKVELNLEEQVASSLDKILEEKKRHLERLIKEEDDKENEEEEVKVENKEKKRMNIWEKRTVGEVFDEALKRYLARKAEREAMKG